MIYYIMTPCEKDISQISVGLCYDTASYHKTVNQV